MRAIPSLSFRKVAPFVGAAFLTASLGLGPARAQDKGDDKKDQKAPEGPEAEIKKQIKGFLKDELDLSTEQTGKVEVIISDAFNEAIRAMLKGAGEGDENAIEKQRKEMQERITGRIKEILDDGQKREFDALVKEFETRSGRWKPGRERPGGDAAAWLEGDLPSADVLLARAQKALILSEDEQKVLIPQIEKAIAARIALHDARSRRKEDLAKAVAGGAKEDEVKERLHDLRSKEDELGRALERACEAVRELVTVDQEARLVAIGVLD